MSHPSNILWSTLDDTAKWHIRRQRNPPQLPTLILAAEYCSTEDFQETHGRAVNSLLTYSILKSIRLFEF